MISLFILQGQASGLLNLLFPLLLLVFFYFFFIRPQVKKQKEQSAFSSSLQRGDEVVTASGIIGKINKIDTNEINLELDSKTFIRVVPTAISKEMTDQFRNATKA
jgi:preprotein translocase subunit YajC